MRDPKIIYGDRAINDFIARCVQLKDAAFALQNDADDLWLDQDADLPVLYAAQELADRLLDFQQKYDSDDD